MDEKRTFHNRKIYQENIILYVNANKSSKLEQNQVDLGDKYIKFDDFLTFS